MSPWVQFLCVFPFPFSILSQFCVCLCGRAYVSVSWLPADSHLFLISRSSAVVYILWFFNHSLPHASVSYHRSCLSCLCLRFFFWMFPVNNTCSIVLQDHAHLPACWNPSLLFQHQQTTTQNLPSWFAPATACHSPPHRPITPSLCHLHSLLTKTSFILHSLLSL